MQSWSDKGFKDFVLNRTYHSDNEGYLEIT